MTILTNTRKKITITVPEADAKSLKVGDKIEFIREDNEGDSTPVVPRGR